MGLALPLHAVGRQTLKVFRGDRLAGIVPQGGILAVRRAFQWCIEFNTSLGALGQGLARRVQAVGQHLARGLFQAKLLLHLVDRRRQIFVFVGTGDDIAGDNHSAVRVDGDQRCVVRGKAAFFIGSDARFGVG